MASKRKLNGEADLPEAEEPPKKITDLDKDTLPKDNTDCLSISNSETSADNKGLFEKSSHFFNQLSKLQEVSEDPDMPDGGLLSIGDKFKSPDSRYKLKKSCPLPVVIFNNPETRAASRKDGNALVKLFQEDLKLPVCYYDSALTNSEFKKIIHRFRHQNCTNLGGLVVVVMTHGKEDGILLFGNECESYVPSQVNTQEDLIDVICENETLVGKPKVFIIVACRGFSHCPGMEYVDGRDKPGAKTLPKNADVLVAYATSEGQVALRDKKNGSWYVQEFVEVVKKNHSKCHLVELLTQVQKQVAEKTSQTNGVTKNMPEFTSSLRKKLYLVYK